MLMAEMATVSEIRSDTQRVIERLYNNGDLNLGALASLRNSNSIASRKAANVMPILFSEIKEKSVLSKDGSPTYGENAIFTALRCYAIYQQGNRDTCVFKKEEKTDEESGIKFCAALASLRQDEKIREALDRRMQVLLTANNFSSVNNTIIRLLQILKGHNRSLKIDFADLAGDLYVMQFSNESARRICLKWGEQYYWTKVDNKEKK